MNIQLYDKLTLLCMAAAITSAVLFDKVEPYGWVAAALGIGSASASILMYLFLRERETDQDVSETENGDHDVALRSDLPPATQSVRLAALSSVDSASDAIAPSKVHLAGSRKSLVSATTAGSSKRRVALDIREPMYIVESHPWAGSAWVIMEIGHAGEPDAGVHIKRQKRTSFDTLDEAGFGRTSWGPLWITVFTATELAGLSRGFRKESRRQKSFASPEALSVLPGVKERLYH